MIAVYDIVIHENKKLNILVIRWVEIKHAIKIMWCCRIRHRIKRQVIMMLQTESLELTIIDSQSTFFNWTVPLPYIFIHMESKSEEMAINVN